MLGRTLWNRSSDPPTALSLSIEGGQVSCPARGVVDLERCFMCPAFEGTREGATERLLCRPERDPAGVATLDETWRLD
jgi:hypothetical protein